MEQQNKRIILDRPLEHKALAEQVRDEWLAIGLSTEQSTQDEMKAAVDKAYRCAELEPPDHYFFFDSPRAGALAVAVLEDHEESTSNIMSSSLLTERVQEYMRRDAEIPDRINKRVREISKEENRCSGQHEAGWLSRMDFFDRVGVDGLKQLDGLKEVARHCGRWWPMESIAVVTAKATELHRDDQGHLHHPDGKAIQYPDGWGLYCWHNVRVPEKVILRPQTITDQDIENASPELGAIMQERRDSV